MFFLVYWLTFCCCCCCLADEKAEVILIYVLLHAPWLLSLAALNVLFIIVFQHRHWYDFSLHLFCLGFIKLLGYSSVLKKIVAIISLYIVLAQSSFSICKKWHTCLATWYCYTHHFVVVYFSLPVLQFR